MSFAAPLALLFFGLFLPVILLYLLKQRRRRVEVSTLMFWDQILRDEQTVTSMARLKKWVSLLLQLLFIALLTLALARPLLSGKVTGARRIVVLFDTSASMLVREGNSTRFELAQAKAQRIVRSMSIGDSLMLISMAAEPEILHPFTDHRKELNDAIAKLQPVHTSTDLKKALELVHLLPADSRQTDVYIVSDGAVSPVTIDPPPRTRFAWVRVGEQTDNIGITAFQVRPLPGAPRDFQVHLEISNQTAQNQRVPVELRVDNRLLDAWECEVPAGKSVTRALRQFSQTGGLLELRLAVQDAFALDDRAFAVLPQPKPVKVALVTENNLFLERALATDDEVELHVVNPAQYTNTNSAEVTVFAGWHPPRTPRGNSIFVGGWPDDLGLTRKGELAKPLFTDWKRDHPINRHLALQNVRIEKAVEIQAAPGCEVLAASFGAPLSVFKSDAERRVLVTAFDTTATDLPLRVAFPILIANAVRFLGQIETTERWINPLPGSLLSSPELDRFLEGKPGGNAGPLRSLIDPQGSSHTVVGRGELLPVNQVGVYQGVTEGGKPFPLFAANLVSAAESRITPADSLPLKPSKGELSLIEERFRVGFEPWFFLAALGLLLTTTEWGLFHRRVIE